MRGKAAPTVDLAGNFQFLNDAKNDAVNKIAQARACEPVLFAKRLSARQTAAGEILRSA
jgi:hypothetical protein